MRCITVAPRPPYSLGQLTATHPPSLSFLCHRTRASQSPSPSSAMILLGGGANFLFASSHDRTSTRNASSSGLKLKSIFYPCRLCRPIKVRVLRREQSEHPLADNIMQQKPGQEDSEKIAHPG